MMRQYSRPEIRGNLRNGIRARSMIAIDRPAQRFSVSTVTYRVVAVLLFLIYSAVSLSATNTPAGVYAGEIFGATDSGKFAMLLRANGQSAVVYFDGFDEEGGFKDGISVGSDGSFSFQLPSPPFDTATGQVIGASVSGAICCTRPGEFSGQKSPTSGFFLDYGGLYRGSASGTSTEDGVTYQVEGDVIAIVDAVGSTVILVSVSLSIGGQIVENGETGGMININNVNLVSGTLLDGVVMVGSFTPATLSASGTFSFSDVDTSSSGDWSMTRIEALPPTNEPDSTSNVSAIMQLLLKEE